MRHLDLSQHTTPDFGNGDRNVMSGEPVSPHGTARISERTLTTAGK
jgi:hypothetical protein